MRGTLTQRSPGSWRPRVVTDYDAEGRPKQLSLTVQEDQAPGSVRSGEVRRGGGTGTAPLSGSLTFGQHLEERWLPQHCVTSPISATTQRLLPRAIRAR